MAPDLSFMLISGIRKDSGVRTSLLPSRFAFLDYFGYSRRVPYGISTVQAGVSREYCSKEPIRGPFLPKRAMFVVTAVRTGHRTFMNHILQPYAVFKFRLYRDHPEAEPTNTKHARWTRPDPWFRAAGF